MTEPKKIMPRPEVKRLLNIKSDFTLANMRVEGRGPRYFKTGKMVQYLEEDVWEYILRARTAALSSF